ncbi:ryncolin-1-like [Saccostrea cucullata]|uniref:ryncolin-1-like n=1 Tax=Saccostrea cuccullata TaxID=36930 RepID=UPI002ED04EAB
MDGEYYVLLSMLYIDITWREVYCDMTTDGGGWTVIQKREDGDVDFYRTWTEYKKGFGNVSKNYWIGNDAIHTLTKDKSQELRVVLGSYDGEEAYAVYTSFYIRDENDKYKITVSGYSGTAVDSFSSHNGMAFSTKDQDNDINAGSCAVSNRAAWWYNSCHHSNLNGEYGQSGVTGDSLKFHSVMNFTTHDQDNNKRTDGNCALVLLQTRVLAFLYDSLSYSICY